MFKCEKQFKKEVVDNVYYLKNNKLTTYNSCLKAVLLVSTVHKLTCKQLFFNDLF